MCPSTHTKKTYKNTEFPPELLRQEGFFAPGERLVALIPSSQKVVAAGATKILLGKEPLLCTALMKMMATGQSDDIRTPV